MASERVTWLNWHTLLQDATPEPDDQGDTRTGSYCRGDAHNAQSYLEYLKVISLALRNAKARASGGKNTVLSGPAYMFDLGFIPVTMTPSYWDGSFTQEIYQRIQKARIPIYSRAPVGFSYYTYNQRVSGAQPEWWVSKMDIAERLHIRPEQVTMKEVCQACGLALQ